MSLVGGSPGHLTWIRASVWQLTPLHPLCPSVTLCLAARGILSECTSCKRGDSPSSHRYLHSMAVLWSYPSLPVGLPASEWSSPTLPQPPCCPSSCPGLHSPPGRCPAMGCCHGCSAHCSLLSASPLRLHILSLVSRWGSLFCAVRAGGASHITVSPSHVLVWLA